MAMKKKKNQKKTTTTMTRRRRSLALSCKVKESGTCEVGINSYPAGTPTVRTVDVPG